MWHVLEKISEQVVKYSTFLGQIWYLCVFMFRLIVVVTIGSAVYGDEQGSFKCSTDVVGCTNMCFNVFSKISHIRFWAFQLLAVATPTVFFHLYSMSVTGQIEKLKKEREALKLEEGDMDVVDNPKLEKDFRKMSRRKKSIGHVKVKKVYAGGDLQEVPYTRKIHYAYFISVVFRLAIEAVFIYLGYQLFKFLDPTAVHELGAIDFILFKVPGMFICTGDNPEVRIACYQHVGITDGSNIPCWVSRPWEKTIFLRYMNIFSAICFLLCALELVYLVLRGFMRNSRKRRPRFLQRTAHPRQDSVFYATAPNGHHLQNENFYPTLAVPVRLSSRYLGDTKNGSEKKVRISDEEMIETADLGSTASAKS